MGKPRLVRAVISGGQTGADIAGLRAAHALRIPTGGYVPKGYLTEDGVHLKLRDIYDLVEAPSDSYEERTELNVKMSDGTVIFGRRSRGSNLTERLCQIHNKPFMWIWHPEEFGVPIPPQAFRLWVKRNKIQTLNVAGNRHSKNPTLYSYTFNYLKGALA